MTPRKKSGPKPIQTPLRQWLDSQGGGDYGALASASGCRPSSIAQICAGTRRPGILLAQRLQRVTGLSMDLLLQERRPQRIVRVCNKSLDSGEGRG
jgi:transcriptional regulator with XRE-family HTH domain